MKTAVEIRLADMAKQIRLNHANEHSVGAADVDAGCDAIALLRRFDANEGQYFDYRKWQKQVSALLSRCNEEAS